MRSPAWIAIGILASAPAHAAEEPRALDPSSDWALEHSEERCSLVRKFGTGRDELALRLASYGRSAGFQLMLVGGPVPRTGKAIDSIRYGFPADRVEREPVQSFHRVSRRQPWAVTFDVSFRPYEAEPALGTLPPEEALARRGAPDLPSPEFERQADRITVEFADRTQVALNLGDMAEPLERIRRCVGELHRLWGLDPAQQQTLTRQAVPEGGSATRLEGGYPMSNLLGDQSMFIPVRIMVDAAGQAGECVVQIRSVSPAFQEVVCVSLTRRFSPALDRNGQPTASVFPLIVVYSVE